MRILYPNGYIIVNEYAHTYQICDYLKNYPICSITVYYNQAEIDNLISKYQNWFKFSLVSDRIFGEPKLKKPKELNNIKQSGNISFCRNKCKCPYFIKGDDIYIKHQDYFSKSFEPPIEDMGAPLNVILNKYFNKNKANKFVYPDCWGDVVLRNEAWIKLENIMLLVNDYIPSQLAYMVCQQQKEYHKFEDDLDTEWEIFYERLFSKVRKTLDNQSVL